jgi:hypothetical protein
MNDVRTRTVVCCYHGKVGTDLIAADNSTGMHIIHYSIEHTAFSAEYTLFNIVI